MGYKNRNIPLRSIVDIYCGSLCQNLPDNISLFDSFTHISIFDDRLNDKLIHNTKIF
jgi:hypothetical protein